MFLTAVLKTCAIAEVFVLSAPILFGRGVVLQGLQYFDGALNFVNLRTVTLSGFIGGLTRCEQSCHQQRCSCNCR